jgi:hypothetical protein
VNGDRPATQQFDNHRRLIFRSHSRRDQLDWDFVDIEEDVIVESWFPRYRLKEESLLAKAGGDLCFEEIRNRSDFGNC